MIISTAQDHPETIIMWETDELPKATVMESDAALFIKRDKTNNDPRPGEVIFLPLLLPILTEYR